MIVHIIFVIIIFQALLLISIYYINTFCWQVPAVVPRVGARASPPVPALQPEVPTAYNDKVVAFLRQPNIMDILRERHPQVATSPALRDKVNAVRVDGTQALNTFSHDIQLTILLRYFNFFFFFKFTLLILHSYISV